jgi:hypothetical protein
MFRKTLVRAAAFGLLFAAGASGAAAQVTVGGALGLSFMGDVKVIGEGYPKAAPGIGYGGIIQADFRLPVSVPVFLGAQIGVGTANFTISAANKKYEETILTVPILARLAYHVALSPQIGIYGIGKIGYAFGFWEGDYKTMMEKNGASTGALSGFAWEIGVGAVARRGLFPIFDSFMEISYGNHVLEGELSGGGFSQTVRVPLYFFITAGISITFDWKR